MTLNKKFKDVMYDAITYKQQEDSFVQIAEEFAIGFAEWFHQNCYEDNVGYYRAEELLEIYKKEKGL